MKYLICNLKANKNKDEMIKYERELSCKQFSSNIELIVCPSTPFLFIFQDSKFTLGSQDVSKFNEGPYTGEVTAYQLSSLNVKYVLVGHSERRKYLRENEADIVEKIKKSYHSHIHPIYFIGETLAEKQSNQTAQILEKQLSLVINEVPIYKRSKMLIVYEPVWAIGTSLIPNEEDIRYIITFIKNFLKAKYDITIPVLYGGSVNKNNIEELSSIKELDGLIVGESSKDAQQIIEIYNSYQKNI